MATAPTRRPALLESILDDVVRRLPYEAAWALAEAPPIEAGENDPIGELTRLLQARCRRRVDEPEYNAQTWEARRELESGGGVRYESVDAMLADLKS
jgi:hypothetical protein